MPLDRVKSQKSSITKECEFYIVKFVFTLTHEWTLEQAWSITFAFYWHYIYIRIFWYFDLQLYFGEILFLPKFNFLYRESQTFIPLGCIYFIQRKWRKKLNDHSSTEKRTSALNNSYKLLTLQSSIKLPNYCMRCHRTANKIVAN